jgi:hypothetical protein
VDRKRHEEIERRWQEIYRNIAEAERSGDSPLTGVDAELYCQQLLEELDELKLELGMAYFEKRGRTARIKV